MAPLQIPGTTLAGLLPLLAQRGEREALVQLLRHRRDGGDGADIERWQCAELAHAAERLAQALRARGLEAGQRALLFAPNSPRWIIACLALLRLGVIPVPVDSQAGGSDLSHIVSNSGARWAFTAERLVERLGEAVGDSALQLVLLDADAASPDRPSDDGGPSRHQPLLISELTAIEPGAQVSATARRASGNARQGADNPRPGDPSEPDPQAVAESDAADADPAPHPAPDPEGEAVLFYTSGTSGPPKGVPLTHRNLLSNVEAILSRDIVSPEDRLLLPLPLHHVYPFAVGLLAPLSLGIVLVLPQSLTGPQLVRALKQGEVTAILGIPRLYQALLAAVRRRIGAGGRAAVWLFDALLRVSATLRRRGGVLIGKPLFAPLRRRFAPRLRLLISGGAALDPKLARELEGFGWTVATGYGLTETSPILTVVAPGERRFERAGRPLPGVDLRIRARRDEESASDRAAGTGGAAGADDRGDLGGERAGSADDAAQSGAPLREGEVQARGPNVFSGYLDLPDKTAAALDADGWFSTGDLGAIDSDGWLRLSGRASSRIVLSGGENVDPEAIEARLEGCPSIDEAGVLEHEGRLAAVLVPDADFARGKDDEAIAEQLRGEVGAEMRNDPGWRRIGQLQIDRRPLPRTRLGKLRRHLLAQRFRALREGAAADRDSGLTALDELAPEDRQLVDDAAGGRLWSWLGQRFEGRRITPDTDLRLDLGVDSLEWVVLTMDLQRDLRMALEEDAIGRIETVRDLLREAAEASEAEGGADAGDLQARLRDPESLLDDAQRKWLRPPGTWLRMLARPIEFLTTQAMRRLFRLDVAGLEHLPAQGPFILAPSHQSSLDPVAVMAALPAERRGNIYWGGWTGLLFNRAGVRLLSRAFRVLPVDPTQGALASLAFGAAALQRGGTLVWFPEGRRSADGSLQPFRAGVGNLALAQDVPIVPVRIEGSGEALPPGSLRPRLRPIRLRMGPAASAAELEREGEGEQAAERIAQALRTRMLALSK
jgi:long-chain acyl-CoA synthetase